MMSTWSGNSRTNLVAVRVNDPLLPRGLVGGKVQLAIRAAAQLLSRVARHEVAAGARVRNRPRGAANAQAGTVSSAEQKIAGVSLVTERVANRELVLGITGELLVVVTDDVHAASHCIENKPEAT